MLSPAPMRRRTNSRRRLAGAVVRRCRYLRRGDRRRGCRPGDGREMARARRCRGAVRHVGRSGSSRRGRRSGAGPGGHRLGAGHPASSGWRSTLATTICRRSVFTNGPGSNRPAPPPPCRRRATISPNTSGHWSSDDLSGRRKVLHKLDHQMSEPFVRILPVLLPALPDVEAARRRVFGKDPQFTACMPAAGDFKLERAQAARHRRPGRGPVAGSTGRRRHPQPTARRRRSPRRQPPPGCPLADLRR